MTVEIQVSPGADGKTFQFSLLLSDDALIQLHEAVGGNDRNPRFEDYESFFEEKLEQYGWTVDLCREDRELVTGTVTLNTPVSEDTVRGALEAAWYSFYAETSEQPQPALSADFSQAAKQAAAYAPQMPWQVQVEQCAWDWEP